MENKPIAVGDLVMIVRWPCCGTGLGDVFKVGAIFMIGRGWCLACNTNVAHFHLFAESDAPTWSGRLHGAPVAWLKRLDPDALQHDVPVNEELTV